MRNFKSVLYSSSSSRRTFSLMLATAMLAIATSSFALDIGKLITNDPTEPDKFKVIHVADLEAMIANKSSGVQIYDANGWGLRSRVGIIPGAHLLTSDDKYDITTTLPPDKTANLVFYCADTL
jgi:hypothetical protein